MCTFILKCKSKKNRTEDVPGRDGDKCNFLCIKLGKTRINSVFAPMNYRSDANSTAKSEIVIIS